jgi:hypothetical protein
MRIGRQGQSSFCDCHYFGNLLEVESTSKARVMHKKRTYRRRARTGSDSEEEAGIATTEQSGIPKPIGLSFDDTLESDIPFVPRAPRARSSQNSSILDIPAETDDQQQSQAVTLEGADSRLSVTLVESKGYSVFASTPIAAGKHYQFCAFKRCLSYDLT